LDLNSLPQFSVADNPPEPNGRLVALDLGAKRVGVAVSDELQITVTPLPFIERRSWKDLLRRVTAIIEGYDARGLVIGLPLGLDGSDGDAAQEARRLAENFRRSLIVPVYLQDERLTTFAAQEKLKSEGVQPGEFENRIDSESAALILRDFMETRGRTERPEPAPPA
jgi:putative pre-16S rRNA nuclease